MEPFIIEAQTDVPIICDMTTAADTPEQRLAEYGQLFDQALVARERTEDAVILSFAPQPGVFDHLCDLVRREAACCPFLGYAVDPGPDVITLRVTAAGEMTRAILDELHDLPEHHPGGLEALLSGLSAAGTDPLIRR